MVADRAKIGAFTKFSNFCERSHDIATYAIKQFSHDECPERNGYIPKYMMSTNREDFSFVFGTKKIGLLQTKNYIGKPTGQDGHIMIFGGSGSFKTTSETIPNLASPSTIITIDIKQSDSESGLVAQWHRLNANTGKRLKVFSPDGKGGSGFDPFITLRYCGKEKLVRNVRELALSLLPKPPEVRDPVWIKGAQNILTAAIYYYLDLGFSFSQAMEEMQLTTIDDLSKKIRESDNKAAKMYMIRFHKVDDKTLANVGMDLTDLIVFAIDPQIQEAFSSNNADIIDWSDLNSTDNIYDIILQIPEDMLEQWENPLIMMLNQLVRTLERRPEYASKAGRELPPILIMLDEFPRLGMLKVIQSALDTLRSRGITICLMSQSRAKMVELYGEEAVENMIENFTYMVILKAQSVSSQKYFSEKIGTCEVWKKSYTINYEPGTDEIETSRSVQWSRVREPIIFPHEFATLKDMVITHPDGFCRADKNPYYKDKAFMAVG